MEESSASLVRSFSQPSPTSSEKKKVNPIQRALTSSISFGRFVTESLDWGKWSAFNHNRYLEEVEKCSKPGSVAEKKAYFEAHYKRKRAAALLEQQNTAVNTDSETNPMHAVDNSSADLELTQRNGHDVSEKTNEFQNYGTVLAVGQNDFGLDHVATGRTLDDIVENHVELTNILENDECFRDMVSDEYKIHDNDAVSMRSPQSSNEEEPQVSSSEILSNVNVIASENTPCIKPMVPVQLQNSDKRTPNSKNSGRESSNKRRPAATSLHMSIAFASGFCDSQKATSPDQPKVAKSRSDRPPANKFTNGMTPRTKASFNGTIKHHLEIPPSENTRTKTIHSDSISGLRRIFDGKLQSPMKNSQSSNALGNKVRTSTVSAPFIFKSEERVAKRKEFFEKLEQKLKINGSEKDKLLENSQGKAKGDLKILRHSIALQATKNSEVPLTTESSNILTKKMAFAKPKIQERVSFKAQDNDPRPPWRFSLKTTDSSKDVAGKNNRTPVSSIGSLKKSTRENNCPNTQASLVCLHLSDLR